MARIRSIKPEFWADEKVAGLPRDARLLFIGLWNFADDSGRMRGSPLLIRAQIFPYDNDPTLDVASLLRALDEASLITRYDLDGQSYIAISGWAKHQKIDRPSKSLFPEPPQKVAPSSTSPRRVLDESSSQEGRGREGSRERKGVDPSAAPSAAGAVVPIVQPAKSEKQPDPRNLATWQAYKAAYRQRYGEDPVRNDKVNSQIKQFVQRIGDEAPEVAAFYVQHAGAFYAQKVHAFGPLLQDAEALRTQWATGNQITGTKARQDERTQTNAQGWGALLSVEGRKHGMD